jgi:hypothetical protein
MVEKAGETKWGSNPVYMDYMKKTPCLIPRFSLYNAHAVPTTKKSS